MDVRNIDKLHALAKITTDECINWEGSLYNSGYGVLRKANKMVSAHREQFLHTNGYLPEVVMHSCDNRKCVNPKHLLAGTTQYNVDDKVRKNRHLKGSTVGNAKLNETQVAEIKTLIGKMYQKQIAIKYNVSQTLISQIQRGVIWTHVRSSS